MRTLVLASGSSARAAVLAEAGVSVVVDPADVDEREHDELLGRHGAAHLALHLASLKAGAVADRYESAVIIAADQVAVLPTPSGPVQLHKQRDFDDAVRQLLSMSGTSHELVNGLVVLDTASGRSASGVDVQVVTMRTFDRRAASNYVERFAPYDSAGSYRIEDQDLLAESERLLCSVVGEDVSGVRGMPLPLLRRLLGELGVAV